MFAGLPILVLANHIYTFPISTTHFYSTKSNQDFETQNLFRQTIVKSNTIHLTRFDCYYFQLTSIYEEKVLYSH